MVELGQDIEFCGSADRTISRLVELGRNIDVLMFWSRIGRKVSRLVEFSRKVGVLCRSNHISLGRTWSKHRCFGGAGRNVSRLVEPGQNIEVRGRADRNISRSVELGPNLDVLVAPVKTYLAWSYLVKT